VRASNRAVRASSNGALRASNRLVRASSNGAVRASNCSVRDRSLRGGVIVGTSDRVDRESDGGGVSTSVRGVRASG
jgi:hypothetical protein